MRRKDKVKNVRVGFHSLLYPTARGLAGVHEPRSASVVQWIGREFAEFVMMVRFHPEAPNEKPGTNWFRVFHLVPLLRCVSCDSERKTGLLAVCGVLLDNTRLSSLIKSLVGILE